MAINRKIIRPALGGLLLLLVAGLLLVIFYLPLYIETVVLPGLFAQAGISSFAGKVRRLGLTGADLGELALGGEGRGTILIDSVRLDYNLPQLLLKRRISRLAVSGLTLTGADLAWPEAAAAQSAAGRPGALPLAVDRLVVRQAVLQLDYRGKTYRLPFDLDATSAVGRGQPAPINCEFRFYPAGQPLKLTARLDLAANHAGLIFAAPPLPLDSFAGLTRSFPGLAITGQGLVAAAAEIQLRPLRLLKFDATAAFRQLDLAYQGLILQNRRPPDQDELPLCLEINGAGDDWRLQLAGLSSPAPWPWQGQLRAAFQQLAGFEGRGEVDLLIEGYPDNKAALALAEPLHATAAFSAAYRPGGAWQFDLAGPAGPQAEPPAASRAVLRSPAGELALTLAAIRISGQGHGHRGLVQGALQWRDVVGQLRKAVGKVPVLDLHGHYNLGLEPAAVAGEQGGFEITAADTAIQVEDLSIKGGIVLAGQVQRPALAAGAGRNWQVSGRLGLTEAAVADLALNAKASGIAAEIPWQWPVGQAARPGQFSVGALHFRTWQVGTLAGLVRQDGTGLLLEARHDSDLLAGLRFAIDGEVRFLSDHTFESRFAVQVPAVQVAPVDLGKYWPGAQGLTLAGDFELQGDWQADAAGGGGSLRTELRNARLAMNREEILVEELAVALSLVDLPRGRSLPAQRLSFGKAKVGGLSFDGGEIVFQVERPATLFIEKSTVSWCQGHLVTPALRLRPGTGQYDLVLNGDRLDLAEVLGQFGVGQVQGQGTVSGSIPFRFKEGRLYFGDGFLYSTPGVGGKIRVPGAGLLTAAVGRHAPQYAQLDFAEAALQDFDYNSVLSG